MVGLEVNGRGMSYLTQLNTYHPQLKIYNGDPNGHKSHILVITTALFYISRFKESTSVPSHLISLPYHQGPRIQLGQSTFNNHPGLNLRLRLNGNGNGIFTHHPVQA